MSTILMMCSTPSRLVAGAVALFRAAVAPIHVTEPDAGYGRELKPRWFRAFQTLGEPRRSARWQVLDPLM
ncbi:hypothetical protein [Saccharopolyspora thermophila]|uniref:hypothetical protein n=1 Tax=Saccharopolyspora thermophila TaxID=89367 RepID=UPI00166B5F61|nr:hypothetical protein [Saccharopolyspora subtropica]